MIQRCFLIVYITIIFLSGCNNSTTYKTEPATAQTDTSAISIPFSIGKNYFVKNTIKSIDNPKIETAEKFFEVFGMATTMGPSGKPTEIDFSKQYVIAVLLPKTDLATTVAPIGLQRNAKGEITLLYKVVSGAQQTFTSRPQFIVIVNKTESGPITVREVK